MLMRRVQNELTAWNHFVRSKKHVFAKFDAVEPLVLLHLYAVENGIKDRVPIDWPTSSFFHCPYDGVGRTYDNSVIYSKVGAD